MLSVGKQLKLAKSPCLVFLANKIQLWKFQLVNDHHVESIQKHILNNFFVKYARLGKLDEHKASFCFSLVFFFFNKQFSVLFSGHKNKHASNGFKTPKIETKDMGL